MRNSPSFFLLITCLVCSSIQSVVGGDLKLTENDDLIRVTLRGKPVLEYIKTEKPVPEGIEPHYRRSGYIHPVFTPTGQEITGDFPEDHAHQHALFFAWAKASYDGKKWISGTRPRILAGSNSVRWSIWNAKRSKFPSVPNMLSW